ncbi:hypothetical protein [Methylobacterium sp. Leaf118]|uniref:hypothetical protein n=1 Tax=Methylobacterium sp. Leaf118 TaxID=2876562 RepID=UPI001E651E82|nr:hypothetical protein [Methylobacterium sp. Leaf118]
MKRPSRPNPDGSGALPPLRALAEAGRLLAGHGFREVARNDRGDSLYFARDAGPERLRLSNHARTPKQRRGHPEVVASLVIRQPKTRGQVAALVEATLRNVAGHRLRAAQAGTASRAAADPSAEASEGSP